MIRVSLTENGAYWLARWQLNCKTVGKSLGNRGHISREEAEKACKRLEAALNVAPSPVIDDNPTISGWLETFLKLRPGLAERSAALYRACGDRLATFLGPNKPLEGVTALEAMHFRAWLFSTGHLADQTVYRIMGEARAIFQCAVDVDILTKNPWTKVMPPKPRSNRDWPEIGPDTLEKLLSVTTGRWGVLLGLLRLAGLRRHEALTLKWQNVDLNARKITVVHPGRYQSTKGRTRQVPIEPLLHDILFEASMEGDSEDLVCAGIAGGSLHHGFKVLCQRANIEPWPAWCQVLRRCCETEWAGKYPLHVVTQWMGNSPQIAMRHYLHATEADFERVSGTSSPAQTPPIFHIPQP